MSIDKVALGALRYCRGGTAGSVLFELPKQAEEPLTWDERANIRRAAKQLPQTSKEIERIAGKGLTPGQIKRRVGIGTGLIMGVGTARRILKDPKALTGGLKGIGRVLNPRDLAADAIQGAVFYGAAPGIIRAADVHAAKTRGEL